LGLADRPRSDRPSLLDVAVLTLLEAAVAGSPLDYGYPVATWMKADLTDLPAQRGWPVSRATVTRTLQRLGYRYRRPRHDLTHRRDAEAGAVAKHVLRELQKRGRLPGLGFGLFTWIRACFKTLDAATDSAINQPLALIRTVAGAAFLGCSWRQPPRSLGGLREPLSLF
jgi:hypothetical protein